jgi:integrase
MAHERGAGNVYRRGDTWWLVYWLRGERFRESAETCDEKQARKMLRDKMKLIHADQVGAHVFQTPKADKLTIHDLLEALKADYTLRGKASGQNLSHIKRADQDFGDMLATALTPERIDRYVQDRLTAKDRPAAVNRATQFIRQSFTLAVRNNRIVRAPYIRRLSEKGNERKGFIEEGTYRKIRDLLPSYLQDMFTFSYCTGMRFGETVSLKWSNVKGDTIELEALDAKTGEPRLIPMVGADLAGVLARRRKEARKVKCDGISTPATLVFHHNGHEIVDVRKAWRTAVKRAGVPGLLWHDLRRSAVKNMDEAGVSRDAAMSITGHKTQAMYSRYNIVDTKRVRQALEQTQVYREATAGKVVAINQ